MSLTIQRSLPIPRIKIDKLLDYIKFVGDKGLVDVKELKESNIDFGKGKGDLTRFFLRLNIVTIQDNKVKLTDEGLDIYKKLNVDREVALKKFHEILYEKLIQYRITLDIVKTEKKILEEDLYQKVNLKIQEISPSTWINRVAFKTILGLLQDLGLIVKIGREITYRGVEYIDVVEKCIRENIVEIENRVYVNLLKLSECICRVTSRNVDLSKLKNVVSTCVRYVVSPSSTTIGSDLCEVLDLKCLMDKVLEAMTQI